MKLNSSWKSRKRSCWSSTVVSIIVSIMRPTTILIVLSLAICHGFVPQVNSFEQYNNPDVKNVDLEPQSQRSGPVPDSYPSMSTSSGSALYPNPYLYPYSTRYGEPQTKPQSKARINSRATKTNFYSRLVGGVDSESNSIKAPISSAGLTGGPWGRNWFPRAPEQGKPIEESSSSGGMKMDKHGRVQMGVANKDCDDARTNLTRDWDFSPVDYTCFHPETRFPFNTNLQPVLNCVELAPNYMPSHLCMNETITYADKIPTYGNHRPLWPKFGEYLYVPKQRWLHNIEHGAVVMLYHPCAHPEEVKQLKSIVTHCYGKHVITPDTDVDPERPLVLVAWGCILKMAVVDEPLVIKFIHEKSMKGPEGPYTKEGQFDFGLLRSANETKGSRYDKITCGSPVM